MKRLVAIIAALWMGAAGTAVAEDQPVVIELFTSQGCSSCPPADEILGQLAKRDNVIALAMHVDYWDYLGWKDEFADPAHTKRQRAYARAKGERTIYTPQMVIGGQDHVIGSRPMKIMDTIRKHANKRATVAVQLKRSGGKVSIEARAIRDLSGDAVVQLVTFVPKSTVKIRRGENAGRTLTYHNVVQDLVRLGTWNGNSAYSTTANVPDGLPIAVLVQARNGGVMLGAAQLR